MQNIKHPYGNRKANFVKIVKSLLQNVIKLFVGFIFKLDKNDTIIISSATHAPWLKDQNFRSFYSQVNQLTLLDEPRAYTLWQFSKNLKNTEGISLDIGCLKGGSGFILSKANKKGEVHLFDSFSGFKKDEGIHKRETFYFDDIEFVKDKINEFSLKNTYVHKAFFPDNLNIKIQNIKLCHIDVNTYIATKLVFNFVKDLMIKGGVIILDDFGIWGVNGVKRLVYEIEANHSDFYFIKNYMGQCILIKRL